MNKEGRKFIYAFLTIALFCILTQSLIGFIIAGIFIFLATFSIYFFRDPRRNSNSVEKEILSPADGKVVFIGDYKDPAFGECVRIGIFMSLFDVHVNRAPFAGTVEMSEHISGKFLHAEKERSFENNERQIVGISTDYGPLSVHLIAGMIARRIVPFIQEGDELKKGQRIGLIRFGSRVETLIPRKKAEIIAKKGQKVKCGESIIAKWR